jgi:hypothetical protein
MMNDQPPNYLEKKYNLNLMPERDYSVKENHWLPQKLGIRFLAFGKTLYCDKEVLAIPDHEFLHIVQFNRFGTVRVIMHYLFHLTKNFCTSFDFAESYVNIPFEQEARDYEQQKKEGNLKNE